MPNKRKSEPAVTVVEAKKAKEVSKGETGKSQANTTVITSNKPEPRPSTSKVIEPEKEGKAPASTTLLTSDKPEPRPSTSKVIEPESGPSTSTQNEIGAQPVAAKDFPSEEDLALIQIQNDLELEEQLLNEDKARLEMQCKIDDKVRVPVKRSRKRKRIRMDAKQTYNKERMREQRQQLHICNEPEDIENPPKPKTPLSIAAAKFRTAIAMGPIYNCVICHRLMYKSAVLHYQDCMIANFDDTIKNDFIDQLHTSVDGNRWICKTCRLCLGRKSVPAQAKINNLQLEEIPDALDSLNQLEKHLIAKRVAFKKLVALPRGGQHGIVGPVVNVPAHLENICEVLPRIPDNCHIIPLKFKRKLVYKGHYMHQFINPNKVMTAIDWLKDNNIHYRDTKITNEEEWKLLWNQEKTPITSLMPDNCEDESYTTPIIVNEIESTAKSDLLSNTQIRSSQNTYTLHEQAEAKHLAIVEVPGDGNCLFHAVNYHLKKQNIWCGESHLLRKNTIEYMETNPTHNGDSSTHFKNFIAIAPAVNNINNNTLCTTNNDSDIAWTQYLENMRNGEWGDHLVIQAIADMFDLSFSIMSTLSPNRDTIVTPRHNNVDNVFWLGHIGELHYTALEPSVNPLPAINEELEPTSENEQNMKHFNEDQNAFEESSELRGLPLNSCLTKETITPDQTISIAPCEGGHPLPMLADNNFEPMAFPTCYPTGKNCITTERQVRLTPRKYFNQRLLDVDGRFASDIDYLFAAQYTVEEKDVMDRINIAMRKTKGETFQGNRLNASFCRGNTDLTNMISNDKAYKFLKDIRGTPAYWSQAQHHMMGMLRQCGKATWFLTLSSADMRWTNPIQSIASQYNVKLTPLDIANMSWIDKCAWLRKNPVTAAREYHHRITSFFSEYLCSPSAPLGEVVDYYVRHEFQARGSPHSHILIWIKNAPEIDKHSDNEVTKFIDQYQHCAIPHNDDELASLVNTLQTHKHSSACRKNGTCRFKFPHPPTTSTIIARENNDEEEFRKATTLLSKINMALNSVDSCTNGLLQILNSCGISEGDYIKALSVTKIGKKIVLKRCVSEMQINYYNPDILRVWRANMDLQYVVDPFACVMYISSYILKSERAMSELLKATAKESAQEDIRSQLKKLGSAFLNHREMSAQEACYRLLSLPLRQSTRTFIFVNTNSSDKRVRFLKPSSQLEKLDDDNEDIYCRSLVDRYTNRPDELENITFSEFAANYMVDYRQITQDHEHHISNPKILPRIQLKNNFGSMYKKKKESIIWFYNFTSGSDEEKARHKLMLYLPWRLEDVDLKGDKLTFVENLVANREQIGLNESRFTQISDPIDEYVNQLNERGPPEHAWDSLAPTVQNENLIDSQINPTCIQEIDPSDIKSNHEILTGKTITSDLGLIFKTESSKGQMTSQEYRQRFRGLNPKQRDIVTYSRKWCIESAYKLRTGQVITPYYLFLSGAGGVGKSHVIKLIQHDCIRIFRKSGNLGIDDIPVLLTGPTGTSAFQIGGLTLHSAFSFAPSNNNSYRPLGCDKLSTLRTNLGKLQLLIIDEVSMVGANMLYNIHRRLEEIMEPTTPESRFGNISILCVGDLFQLSPVLQTSIFSLPSDSYARLHGSLWHEKFQLAELDQVMRQKDQEFANLLNRVRIGRLTSEDIAILKGRNVAIGDVVYNTHGLHDYLHIYTTNAQVDKHNDIKLNEIAEPLFVSTAVDSKRDIQTGLIEVDLSNINTNTGGLLHILKLKKHAHVMLTTNICVADGLSNGACGVIVDIISERSIVCCILVKFDNTTIGNMAKSNSKFKLSHPCAIPIEKITTSFGLGKSKSAKVSRTQFPLKLSWAQTIHKIQGQTVPKIIVNMNKSRFMDGQAYVALSRVTELSGLYIIDFDASKIHANAAVLAEMERLRQRHLPSITDGFQKASVNICHLNVGGFSSKYQDIISDALILSNDIICFNETWLGDSDQLTIPNYCGSVVQLKRSEVEGMENIGHGGIAILISSNTHYTRLKLPNIPLEVIALKLSGLVLISIYRRERQMSLTKFLDYMDIIFIELGCISNLPYLFVGDFNSDCLIGTSSITNYMTRQGYKQIVCEPTIESGLCIDHIYVSPILKCAVTVEDCYYSDHQKLNITVDL